MPSEGADDGGMPAQFETHSQLSIGPSLELGHLKRATKALAFKKISSCGVRAAIPVQIVMSLSNTNAPSNILLISITEDTFQDEMSWLNTIAPSNIPAMLVA